MADMRLSNNQVDVQSRREDYYKFRRSGLDMWSAGVAAGLTDQTTIRRYERWWQQIGQHAQPEGDSHEP